MASQIVCKKNDAGGFTFYVALAPRSPSGLFQAAPTLAAGDVKISKDGGAYANLTTLPVVDPAAAKSVKVVLSQTETNADQIVIIFSDAAGAEWCDKQINIRTVATGWDEMALASATTAISSTLTTIAGYIDTEVAAIKAKTDNLPTDPADASDIAASFASIAATLATIASYVDTEVDAILTKVNNLPSDPADASDIAALFAAIPAAVWDRLTAALTVSGSIGKRLADDVDATISSRLATSGYTAPDNSSITSIKNKTDNLPSDPADQSLIIAATDAIVAAISALNNISAAQVRTQADAALVAYDAPTKAELDAAQAAIVAAIAALNDLSMADLQGVSDAAKADIEAAIAALNNISVADLLAGVIETGFSLKSVLQILVATAGSKVSGAAGPVNTFRNPNDTRDVVTADVDADGNRTAVGYDVTG